MGSSTRSLRKLLLAALALSATAAWAQSEAGNGITRLLVTEAHVKPDMVEEWLALQREHVVPALKKAGVKQYTVYQTVVGETSAFVIVRPLPSFGEFDGHDPLDRTLGATAAATLRSKLGDCLASVHSRIENSQNEFFLDPGPAEALFVSRYRALPGKSRDYMNFVRAEMMPPMRQAQENDTFAGLSVTVSVQGGEPGIITLNMFYDDFAPLDGPPPVAKTLGPEGTAAFLVKGAGLINQLEQSILRRLPELSF